MNHAERVALWLGTVASVAIAGAYAYERWRKTPSISPAAPGAVVSTTTDASGDTVVQLTSGQALGTLSVPVGTSLVVEPPAGQSAPTSFSSSNQAVMPSGALSPPIGSSGVAIGSPLAAGTAALTFYGGNSWGSSFVLVAS